MKKHFLVPCLLLVAGLGCALAMTTMQNNKSKPLQQKKKKTIVTTTNNSLPEDTVVYNLALSKDIDVTASAYVNQNEAPEKACDDNTSTKWCDDKSENKWLQYDLQRDYNIRKIGLIWEHWDPNNIYKVQTSADGITWIDRISETGNTQNTRVYDVNWQNVRLIRFLVSKEAKDDAVRLMEFQVWVRGKGQPSKIEPVSKWGAVVKPAFLYMEGKKKIYSLVPYVDTKVGVIDDKGSNCVIGPQLPFSSINPSPQTPEGEHDGYAANQPIRGFGQLHVSGTGWGKYGHFLLSPQIGLKIGETEHDSPATDEVTMPNYYKAKLTRYGITAEVTPREHAAIYRFTFPESGEANIAMDVTHSLTRDIAKYIGGSVKANSVKIDPSSPDKFSGMIEYEGGFSGGYYKLYFTAQLDKKPSTFGVWKNGNIQNGVREAVLTNGEDRIGSFFTYKTRKDEVIKLKIAISFNSVEQAQKYLSAEIPAWDFDAVKTYGEKKWNTILSNIIVNEAPAIRMKMFYSALYHCLIMPRDRTNEFPAFGNMELWDDHFAVWDTWRTLFPLLTIIQPDVIGRNVQAFINRWKVNGKVKDAYIAGNDMAEEQGGNDVDNIVADAIIKDINGFNKAEAYQYLKFSADHERKAAPLMVGEKGLEQNDSLFYRQYGWLPGGVMAQSTALEYSYNDYCTALAAKKLGYQDDYKKYFTRSQQWVNMWNPNLESRGFKGFICPKTAAGEWIPIDATYFWGSWKRYFYEANAWTYSFFVPHDIDKLIELNGGNERFVKKLNYGFKNSLMELANEPSFLTTRLFTNAGRPDLTCYWVNYVMDNLFTEYAMPGNDDSGAMSSWWLFSAMGFFPNAGQNIYYLNSPLFKSVTIQRPAGNIEISAPNRTDKTIYIDKVTVNGRDCSKGMITYDDIKNGAKINYILKK